TTAGPATCTPSASARHSSVTSPRPPPLFPYTSLFRSPRHAAFLKMIEELHARHLIDVEGVVEVWLIRHADAYAGLEALSDGRVDPPLSSRGREQARLLAGRLAPVRLDAVWARDLRRARETAEEIARRG